MVPINVTINSNFSRSTSENWFSRQVSWVCSYVDCCTSGGIEFHYIYSHMNRIQIITLLCVKSSEKTNVLRCIKTATKFNMDISWIYIWLKDRLTFLYFRYRSNRSSHFKRLLKINLLLWVYRLTSTPPEPQHPFCNYLTIKEFVFFKFIL